jgi:pyruvate,orthophosphate dikinase
MSVKSKFIYGFGEYDGEDHKRILGGKGAGLSVMSGLGFPVPPGFTITTEASNRYTELGKLPEGLMDEVAEHLSGLEERSGKRLGDPQNPLLVSVRSGAPVSMPGMMDTVLNLGLNDDAVEGLAQSTGDRRFAFDSYRRFIQMFSDIVLGLDIDKFENALEELKGERGVEEDTALSAGDLEGLVDTYKRIVERGIGSSFPQEPRRQLELAIGAVFDSWNNERAISYRREFDIPQEYGTAVTVMALVFGNMGESSATGVVFTRNPATGEQGLFGEFLPNAQGEDVVAGIRTPRPLEEMRDIVPEAFGQLLEIMQKLENEYRDMQDVEFTVERDRLYMLQTRSGKRTAAAAIKIARDMAEEGIIAREDALLRIDPASIEQVLHPQIDPQTVVDELARGLAASPGAATGRIVLTADEAAELGDSGEDVILVRRETNPDDVHGVMRSRGVLTALGGITSHAAVVARGFGIPAVTGCRALEVDPDRGEVHVSGRSFGAGDTITIEGSTGRVIEGEVPLVEPKMDEDFQRILEWADTARGLGVRANADTPQDAGRAREYGAQGIGLCRTEHMFMQEERLKLMRRMLLSGDDEALSGLEPLQRGDFEGIFTAMDGLPVTVRLLDPPLHEFLPDSRELVEKVADLKARGEESGELERELAVVESLEEANPMLGLRGCRLGVERPDLYRMQVKAIAEAVRGLREQGRHPVVEVMIPLVGFAEELRRLREEADSILEEVLGEDHGVKVGTMIELPRACATAAEISRHADFFSFGTNDLTQTACGLSRDDAEGGFLTDYLNDGVLQENPFQTLDVEGVGRLVSMAVKGGREANHSLKLGVCGEHGGDPESIEFFHGAGLDYVSCSPLRVPVARLSAARVALGASVKEEGD